MPARTFNVPVCDVSDFNDADAFVVKLADSPILRLLQPQGVRSRSSGTAVIEPEPRGARSRVLGCPKTLLPIG